MYEKPENLGICSNFSVVNRCIVDFTFVHVSFHKVCFIFMFITWDKNCNFISNNFIKTRIYVIRVQ